MQTLIAPSASELVQQAVKVVLAEGRRIQPRGLGTWEVLGVHLCLTDPRRRLADLPPVRVLNPAFAAAEAVWVLAGSDDPWIFQYNRRLRDFADDGRLQGAYGPRLRRWAGQTDQLDLVRRLLLADPATRQAVIQLHDPARDHAGHRDVPCTLGYRFFVRDDRLEMRTTMRSQDAWLGLAYDLFTATVVQEVLAGLLGVEIGSYHHTVDSLHLYEPDLAGARQLASLPRMPGEIILAPLQVTWPELDPLLARLMAGEPVAQEAAQGGWGEVSGVLRSYALWTAGQWSAARQLAAATPGRLAGALSRWYRRLDSATTSPLAPGPSTDLPAPGGAGGPHDAQPYEVQPYEVPRRVD